MWQLSGVCMNQECGGSSSSSGGEKRDGGGWSREVEKNEVSQVPPSGSRRRRHRAADRSPPWHTQPQCYYYGVLLLSHHRILATPSSFLCKLWLHVSTTTGRCIGMIALGCIACFFFSHYWCLWLVAGRLSRACPKKGEFLPKKKCLLFRLIITASNQQQYWHRSSQASWSANRRSYQIPWW